MDCLYAQKAVQDAVTRCPAPIHEEDPGERVAQCFRECTELPPVNPRLRCISVGFVRYRGDWLGVVITPWFMDLVLLPGGGILWGDIPAGQRRYIELPQGTVAFTAAEEPHLGAYQHAPLVSTVSALPDMAAAITLANQAMFEIHGDKAADNTPPADRSGEGADSKGNPETPSRRGFLRRLAGKR